MTTSRASARCSASGSARRSWRRCAISSTGFDPRRRTRILGMPFYQRLGDVPRKRHVQFRDNGTLLTEEVMGLEGFSGNESILYHLTSPCRVEKLPAFVPIQRDEWVPDTHAHRHFRTRDVPAGGDAVSGRRLLMWNQDVEISLARPTEPMEL